MKLETKFDLGEKVWYTKTEVKNIILNPCKYCNGSGEVELKNDDKITCPRCHGNRGEHRTLYLKKPSNARSQIGEVQAKIFRDHRENSYMLFATGVGSGTVYSEDKIFRTKEECQVYCDIENKILEDKFWEENKND